MVGTINLVNQFGDKSLNKIDGQPGSADKTIATTITWDGTPPGTLAAAKYSWSQVADLVFVNFRLEYDVAGATNTQVLINAPADLPVPAALTDWDVSEAGVAGNGFLTTNMLAVGAASAANIIKDAGGLIQFRIASTSQSSKGAIGTFVYKAA